MQKVLGKNYKWWYVLTFQFKSRTTYQIDNALFALGQLLVLLGTILTWYVASKASIDSLDFRQNLTYFLIGTLYFNIINIWTSFYGYEIKKGRHSKELLYPQNIFVNLWAHSFGMAIYQNLVISLMFLLLSPFWLQLIVPPSSLFNLLILVLLLPISHSILFFIEVLVAFAAFFITEINGLTLNFGFLSQLLSGKLFPLGLLLPWFWAGVANPFAFIFYHPMQIYLGNYTTFEICIVFLSGAVWSIIMYLLARSVFKVELKRNESVGL